MLRPDTKFLPQ